MLKRLFTSQARVKLLTIFLLNPEKEYFIRELTRKLDEQINSVRRELDNLKKIGLLRSRMKNRKKYYLVNRNFMLFHELRSIIIKSMNSKENLVKKIEKFGKLDVLVMSGVFVDKSASVDLLAVGELDKAKFDDFLNRELETKKPIKFSILTREDFLYRLKCNDKFIKDILTDPDNIVAVNRLSKFTSNLVSKISWFTGGASL